MGKQTEAKEQGQNETVNDLYQNSCLRLQLGGHYPNQSYGLNLLGENQFKPDAEVSLQEGPVDYQANSFEPTRPGYDASVQTWASTSVSCGVSMFDDHPYSQQPDQT